MGCCVPAGLLPASSVGNRSRWGCVYTVADTASPLQFDPHFPSKPLRNRLLATSREQNRVGYFRLVFFAGGFVPDRRHLFPTSRTNRLRRSAAELRAKTYLRGGSKTESLGMACPRGPKMLQRVLCTEGGERLYFQRESDRSLVSANTPRDWFGLQRRVPKAIRITR